MALDLHVEDGCFAGGMLLRTVHYQRRDKPHIPSRCSHLIIPRVVPVGTLLGTRPSFQFRVLKLFSCHGCIPENGENEKHGHVGSGLRNGISRIGEPDIVLCHPLDIEFIIASGS